MGRAKVKPKSGAKSSPQKGANSQQELVHEGNSTENEICNNSETAKKISDTYFKYDKYVSDLDENLFSEVHGFVLNCSWGWGKYNNDLKIAYEELISKIKSIDSHKVCYCYDVTRLHCTIATLSSFRFDGVDNPVLSPVYKFRHDESVRKAVFGTWQEVLSYELSSLPKTSIPSEITLEVNRIKVEPGAVIFFLEDDSGFISTLRDCVRRASRADKLKLLAKSLNVAEDAFEQITQIPGIIHSTFIRYINRNINFDEDSLRSELENISKSWKPISFSVDSVELVHEYYPYMHMDANSKDRNPILHSFSFKDLKCVSIDSIEQDAILLSPMPAVPAETPVSSKEVGQFLTPLSPQVVLANENAEIPQYLTPLSAKIGYTLSTRSSDIAPVGPEEFSPFGKMIITENTENHIKEEEPIKVYICTSRDCIGSDCVECQSSVTTVEAKGLDCDVNSSKPTTVIASKPIRTSSTSNSIIFKTSIISVFGLLSCAGYVFATSPKFILERTYISRLYEEYSHHIKQAVRASTGTVQRYVGEYSHSLHLFVNDFKVNAVLFYQQSVGFLWHKANSLNSLK